MQCPSCKSILRNTPSGITGHCLGCVAGYRTSSTSFPFAQSSLVPHEAHYEQSNPATPMEFWADGTSPNPTLVGTYQGIDYGPSLSGASHPRQDHAISVSGDTSRVSLFSSSSVSPNPMMQSPYSQNFNHNTSPGSYSQMSYPPQQAGLDSYIADKDGNLNRHPSQPATYALRREPIYSGTNIGVSERPYACPKCDWTFVRKGDRDRHAWIHKAPRYVCEVQHCQRSFRRKYKYNQHMREHRAH